MIKQNINFNQFCDAFGDAYKNKFTYEGKEALFEYLEQYSEDIGNDVELDIIALCYEYTEYENLEEYNDNYQKESDDLEDIENRTTLIRIPNSDRFIIRNY